MPEDLKSPSLGIALLEQMCSLARHVDRPYAPVRNSPADVGGVVELSRWMKASRAVRQRSQLLDQSQASPPLSWALGQPSPRARHVYCATATSNAGIRLPLGS